MIKETWCLVFNIKQVLTLSLPVGGRLEGYEDLCKRFKWVREPSRPLDSQLCCYWRSVSAYVV